MLPIALLFPLLWGFARTRRGAASVSAGYFLAASRGLPQGVAAFYATDLAPGLLLWLSASLGFVTAHMVLWTENQNARPFHYLLAAALMAVPPFGVVGWAHPIVAAGVLFSGWGWWGIVAMTAGLVGLTTKAWPVVALTFGCFWLGSAAFWPGSKSAETWRGVDLDLGASLGRDVTMGSHRDLIAATRSRVAEGARIVVLPESALGFWTPTVERTWVAALQGADVTVIAGATHVDVDGYDNVLVSISRNNAEILYRQRVPVPGSMWQPWRQLFGPNGGAHAHFFANPIVTVGNQRVAPLICYEQLVVWPVLQSMLLDPDLIVAVGNGWWTNGTSIVDLQLASTQAWARLFGKPLILAFNR